MKAVMFHEQGDASQLHYADAAVPEPKPGEARVKVAATGVNFIEIYQRKGMYKVAMPMIPGGEFAGVVDALGEGVTEVRLGERVATASGQGGYAEYAIAPAAKLVPVPESISLELAAAVLLQGITAHYLATSTYPLKPGDTALIHAAAGGVGQLLVQIAKMMGATVIGTASTEEKMALARAAGADHVIQYTQQDFEAETKRLTDNKGVDVVYDGVGNVTFAKGLNVLKPRGYMVLFGQSSGAVEPVDPQTLNQKGSLFLTRPTIAHYLLTRAELLKRATDLFTWMASGELKVRVDQTFPLEQARAAHEYLEARQTKGKVILVP